MLHGRDDEVGPAVDQQPAVDEQRAPIPEAPAALAPGRDTVPAHAPEGWNALRCRRSEESDLHPLASGSLASGSLAPGHLASGPLASERCTVP